MQFQGSFTVGSPIKIQTASLAPGTVVPFAGPLTVNWTGGDPGTLVTMTVIEGTGLAAVGDYVQADAGAGSLTLPSYCIGRPVSAGGNGVSCSLGALPGNNPLTVIIDVTSYPSGATSITAQGITSAVQVSWDYRYVFAGLSLTQ